MSFTRERSRSHSKSAILSFYVAMVLETGELCLVLAVVQSNDPLG